MLDIKTDRVLIQPATQDKEFLKILTDRLNESTIYEISSQGDLKVTESCVPRTLKAVQEVTGVSVASVTDVNTGFFLFQLFRGSATATKTDAVYINTTTSVFDCETGKLLGTYPSQGYGNNPIEALQAVAAYNMYYVYSLRR